MTGERTWDAVVVGSGPNGLAAALTLAAAGRSVLVLEAQDQLGGGLRTEPGIVPGLLHDHCATVLALVPVSPFFRTSGLLNRLAFVQPAAALAHPLDDGSAVLLWPELERTAAGLASDAEAYRRAMRPLLDEGLPLLAALLSPAPGMTRVPGSRVPWSALLRFALLGLQPATRLFARFRTERARALLAGLAAHSTLPLDWAPSAAFAVVLALCAHLAGWPLARGGSGSLAASMADALLARGGALRCGSPVRRLEDLPPARAILFDLVPRGVLAVTGERWPAWYRQRLARFRPAPGVFKVDWVVRDGVPWRAPACDLAGTVHLGGTAAEIAAAERAVVNGQMPDRPFVILVQPSRFDRSRAPAGCEVVWAYCHVPSDWDGDATERIERQIERFAPGFRARVVARRIWRPRDLERMNPNLVGGDLTGGWPTLTQLFTRPSWRPWPPYRTPDPMLFLCSAATPPGGGVHGMCGYWAARYADRWLQRLERLGTS